MKILLVLPAADHLRVESPGGRPPRRVRTTADHGDMPLNSLLNYVEIRRNISWTARGGSIVVIFVTSP